MAFSLTDVPEQSGETLTVREAVTYKSKRLAVAETSNAFKLCRERERYIADDDGKRPAKDAAGQDRPRERYWKPSADLADFRDALASKLIA